MAVIHDPLSKNKGIQVQAVRKAPIASTLDTAQSFCSSNNYGDRVPRSIQPDFKMDPMNRGKVTGFVK